MTQSHTEMIQSHAEMNTYRAEMNTDHAEIIQYQEFAGSATDFITLT